MQRSAEGPRGQLFVENEVLVEKEPTTAGAIGVVSRPLISGQVDPPSKATLPVGETLSLASRTVSGDSSNTMNTHHDPGGHLQEPAPDTSNVSEIIEGRNMLDKNGDEWQDLATLEEVIKEWDTLPSWLVEVRASAPCMDPKHHILSDGQGVLVDTYQVTSFNFVKGKDLLGLNPEEAGPDDQDRPRELCSPLGSPITMITQEPSQRTLKGPMTRPALLSART